MQSSLGVHSLNKDYLNVGTKIEVDAMQEEQEQKGKDMQKEEDEGGGSDGTESERADSDKTETDGEEPKKALKPRKLKRAQNRCSTPKKAARTDQLQHEKASSECLPNTCSQELLVAYLSQGSKETVSHVFWRLKECSINLDCTFIQLLVKHVLTVLYICTQYHMTCNYAVKERYLLSLKLTVFAIIAIGSTCLHKQYV